MHFLLIDIGSTNIKYAIYNNGYKGKVKYVPFPLPCRSDPPFYEVDADKILSLIFDAIDVAGNIEAVYISTQMHGYLLGNAEGHTITPYISWRDARVLLLPEKQRYSLNVPKTRGVGHKPNLPVDSINAIKEMIPDIFTDARCFYTLGSYIAYHLTGSNASHITDLAPSGFFNAITGSKENDVFEQISLPEAYIKVDVIGDYKGIKIYTPVGDQQASVMGSGITSEQYLLNLGTATQMCTLSVEPTYGDFESRPYFNGLTLCTVTQLKGGPMFGQFEIKENLIREMVSEYSSAIKKLPKRESILAIGGVCTHHLALVDEVLKRLNLPFEIRPEPDALDGLAMLIGKDY